MVKTEFLNMMRKIGPNTFEKESKKGAKQSKLYAKVYLFVSQLKPKIMRNGSFHIHFATKREKKNLPIK
jgi:hypothetical protein